MTHTKLKQGDIAPDFTGVDQNGNRISLNDSRFQNKAIVLFFYPKDDSKTCTSEAIEFRDNYNTFLEHGAEVIGVSPDSHQSHQKFVQTNNLPYTIISDHDGEIARRYGLHKELLVIPPRTTFVLTRDHRIDTVHSSIIKADSHIKESLKAIERLKGTTTLPAGTATNTTTNPANISRPIS